MLISCCFHCYCVPCVSLLCYVCVPFDLCCGQSDLFLCMWSFCLFCSFLRSFCFPVAFMLLSLCFPIRFNVPLVFICYVCFPDCVHCVVLLCFVCVPFILLLVSFFYLLSCMSSWCVPFASLFAVAFLLLSTVVPLILCSLLLFLFSLLLLLYVFVCSFPFELLSFCCPFILLRSVLFSFCCPFAFLCAPRVPKLPPRPQVAVLLFLFVVLFVFDCVWLWFVFCLIFLLLTCAALMFAPTTN